MTEDEDDLQVREALHFAARRGDLAQLRSAPGGR
jgi:hypothetical protein